MFVGTSFIVDLIASLSKYRNIFILHIRDVKSNSKQFFGWENIDNCTSRDFSIDYNIVARLFSMQLVLILVFRLFLLCFIYRI